jgi:DNA end-binding protein Ku
VAPEMTRDIELREFVALDEIPATYYEHPYLLVPSGKSSKAYHLLAETMQGSKRAGIGTFVMRGHQYLAAIIADGGLLRLQTLRFANEVRSPAELGLPKAPKRAKASSKLARTIASLKQDALDAGVLADRYADKLHELAEAKQKKKKDVIHIGVGAVDEDESPAESGNVVDLMKLIRQSLGANKATVTTGAGVSDGSSPSHKRRAAHGHTRKTSHRAAHHAR